MITIYGWSTKRRMACISTGHAVSVAPRRSDLRQHVEKGSLLGGHWCEVGAVAPGAVGDLPTLVRAVLPRAAPKSLREAKFRAPRCPQLVMLVGRRSRNHGPMRVGRCLRGKSRSSTRWPPSWTKSFFVLLGWRSLI